MAFTIDDPKTEQATLAKTIAKFCYERLTDIPKNQTCTEDRFRELLRSFGEMGFIDAHIPIARSGLGQPLSLQWHIIRNISKHNPGIALSYLAHTILVCHLLLQKNTDKALNSIIEQIQQGNAIACCCISEANAGSDIFSMKTTAIEMENHYILDGEKCWITNAPYADYALVYAKIGSTTTKKMGIFLVDCKNPAIHRSQPLNKIGMKSSPTGSIYFNKVAIPKNNRVDSGNGKDLLFEQLNVERLMLAAGPIGIMDYCFDETLQYIKTRRQFSQPLSKQPVIQAKIADIWTIYQASIAYCEKALEHDHRHQSIPAELAASCYLFSSESAVKLAEEAIQTHGANGYMDELKIGQYWQDAKLYTIGGGSNEIRRWLIGRKLTAY